MPTAEAEAIGRPCAEVLRSSVCNEKCPFARAFGHEEQVTTFGAEIRGPGEENQVVCINTSVLKNGRGERIGVVESIREIGHIIELMAERETARERAESIARQFEAVLETSEDAVITVDIGCTITSFNRAAELLFGYSRDEVIGEHPREICKAEFCPLEVTISEKRALPGRRPRFPARARHALPGLRWNRTRLRGGYRAP